ncbi:hypothetical protein ASPVEDRAFT_623536 [Aspergillus versicolor CBS 583.65]|uniref:AN1-type domain-containing protein n=1 Tax=Aspergillus versicolor CBS 583.65 TaxID=1036611 RepID=A0A1L9PI71_ASPVE|nr:uncharacterized protein ASPVEDRAFT_623536 [Aspergillus versicolor CBS 583.65]OJJ01219.1 hypothetical protein ASPVEDRAFT_623536 [Aspergillus versicolor CBS 583.65]
MKTGNKTEERCWIGWSYRLVAVGENRVCRFTVQAILTQLAVESLLRLFKACELPSVRGFGPCERCGRRLCAGHRRPPFHICEDTNKPIPGDKFEINEEALCAGASDLNGGHSCEIDYPDAWGRESLMRGAHYHTRTRFPGDVSSLLIRVPRMNSSIP